MEKYENLTVDQQVERLKQKGIIFKDNSAYDKLKYISYYKIKEYAMPFYNNGQFNGNITFDDILERYEQDKNIRTLFLRYCDVIEIAFKTQFARALGNLLGAYGYIDFSQWVDSSISNEERKGRQKGLLKNIDNDFKNKDNVVYQKYLEKRKQIVPVWLMIELLTFGETVDLYKLLKRKEKNKISSLYQLNSDLFDQFIENAKDIRNLSAHNRNVIDLKFSKQINLNDEFNDKLKYADRIATSIYIVEYLMSKIEPEYLNGKMKKSLLKICKNNNRLANELGFKSILDIQLLKV